MRTLIVTAVLVSLGACASPPPTTVAAAKPQAAAACEVPTGSRLPKCADERLRRAIGTQDAQDDAHRMPSISDRVGGRSR